MFSSESGRSRYNFIPLSERHSSHRIVKAAGNTGDAMLAQSEGHQGALRWPFQGVIDGKDGSKTMSPLATALVSFVAFLVVGLFVKLAIGIWMKRSASADADKRSPNSRENGAD